MPEIGLLPFARVAMDVATAVRPTYRSRFSKHQFTQPQLLAILRDAADGGALHFSPDCIMKGGLEGACAQW